MNYYPSSEQVVGEWNGKPLYRKVFTGTPSLTANTVWTSELSPTSGTVDEIVSARGSWKYYDIDNLTNWAIIGNALNEGNVYSAIIKTGTYPMAIRLRTAYTMTSSYKVTVEYTKV